MKIIEYKNRYEEDIKRLLEELQDYIISLDPYGYNIKNSGYKNEVFKIDMDEIEKKDGKVYLAKEGNEIIGLIMGIIHEPIEEYNFVNPNRTGEVIELVVTKNTRSKGVGHELLSQMEEYFKDQDCATINIDVFGYNDIGKTFYIKNGYHNRMMTVSKKI